MGELTLIPGGIVRIVQRGNWGPDSIGKVKRVTKRFAELEDGKKYSLSHGYAYGGKPYQGPHIAKVSPEGIQAIREETRRHKAVVFLASLRREDLKDVPADNLIRAAKLITEP